MNALKMCLNWKVITGVAAATVGLFVFTPSLATAALPFLVLAICPLSMVFMMAMMNSRSSQSSETPQEQLASLEAQQNNLARKIAALDIKVSRTSDTHPGGTSAAARP